MKAVKKISDRMLQALDKAARNWLSPGDTVLFVTTPRLPEAS
jgi:hypothetical protein